MMQLIYIGWFDDVLDWVMKRILNPVFEWIGGLLKSVLTWLFNSVLAPLLESVLLPLAQAVLDMLKEVLAEVFYSILSTIWKFLDTISNAFDIFIGIAQVQDRATGKYSTLLEALYNIDTIRNAFWFLTIIGIVLAFVFATYGVAKSIFDLQPDNPRPVSRVMTSLLRAAVQFLTVPLMVLFLIQFSGVMVGRIDTLVAESSDQGSLGSTLFVVSSLDAAKTDEYNVSSENARSDIGVSDPLRRPFYIKQKDYADVDQVKAQFNLDKFDYIVGLGLSLFLFIVMVSCSMVFIQRIFDMLVLYIASPLFVATIPLDDGEKFRGWRELFLGKTFAGFGSILGMRLYLLIVPYIVGGRIDFSGALGSSVEANYVLKMLFLLGGAWAILKCGPMITSLISGSAASAESATQDVGMLTSFAALKYSARFGKMAMKSTFGGKEGLKSALQDLTGSKDKKQNGKSSGNQMDTKHSKRSGIASKAAAGGGKAEIKGNSTLSAKSGAAKLSDNIEKSFGTAASRKALGVPQRTQKALGMTFKTNRAGKLRPNIQLGSLFTNKYNADGSHTVKFLGMKYRSGADGKREQLRFGGVGASWDANGNRHFDMNWGGLYTRKVAHDGSRKLRIAGTTSTWDKNGDFTNFRGYGLERTRNTETGTMYTKHCGIIGLNREQNYKGEVHTTSLLGYHRAADSNGDYHFSHGYGIFAEHAVNDEGRSELVGFGFGSGKKKSYLFDDVTNKQKFK